MSVYGEMHDYKWCKNCRGVMPLGKSGHFCSDFCEELRELLKKGYEE